MNFKQSLIAFFILMAAGAGSYLAVKDGRYPVAVVDFKIITEKTVRKDFSAAYRYFQNALLVYGSDLRTLDTKESLLEIRRATLDKLISDSLIYKELKNRFPDEFWEIAEKNVRQYVERNSNLVRGAEKIYGLGLSDFEELVLLPQAYKEILESRMFLGNEDFNDWLQKAKANTRIIVLAPDLQWSGEEVKLRNR